MTPAKYMSLGDGLREKLALGLFGILAPPHNNHRVRTRRVLKHLVSSMWLAPRALGGRKLLIDPHDWSQTVILDEIFIQGKYDFRKIRFAPDLVLDCGAHIGLFSLLASAAFPGAEILAFEPNPANAAVVRRAIARNVLPVRLEQVAVAIREEKRRFLAVNSHGGRLIEGQETAGSYEVMTIDLPALLRGKQPRRLLLKLDVEGEEAELLPVLAPLLPSTGAMFFETQSGEAGWSEASRLLQERGFEVQQLNARGLYIDGFAQRL